MKAVPHGEYIANLPTAPGVDRVKRLSFHSALAGLQWEIEDLQQMPTLQTSATLMLRRYEYTSSSDEVFAFDIQNTDLLPHGMQPQELRKLFSHLTTALVAYTAAQVLTNLAIVIKQMPLDDSARDQIIAAVVMAMPNFEDSAQLKSPVRTKLVRSPQEFLEVVRTVQPAPPPISYDEYRAYDSMPRTP